MSFNKAGLNSRSNIIVMTDNPIMTGKRIYPVLYFFILFDTIWVIYALFKSKVDNVVLV